MTELLQQRRSSTVRELAGELKVSEMTVRRDLEVLMDGDIVTVAHGHVLLKNPQAGRSSDRTTSGPMKTAPTSRKRSGSPVSPRR